MSDSVAAGQLAKLQELRALQVATQARKAAAAARVDVFETLGYVPTEKQRLFHDADEFAVFFGGSVGGGKGGRVPDRSDAAYDPDTETKVLTPKGFMLFGDVSVGQTVCNPDGTTAKVIRVTDNGPKQFYRVVMDDGSSVEADEDHLWAVSIASERKRRKIRPPVIPDGLRPEDKWNLEVQTRAKVVSTVELARLVARAEDDKANGLAPRHVQIPLTNPVAMTGVNTASRWPRFSPYILGALIGDGHFGSSISLSGVDEEVFDRVRDELPAGLMLRLDAVVGGCETHRIVLRDGTTDAGMECQAFGESLTRWREKANLSKAALAAISGVSAGHISHIEAGSTWCSEKMGRKLDEALDCGGALFAEVPSRLAESARTLAERDGLNGSRSWNKSIPARIKTSSVADRFAFVQGLMDTDGYMDDRGHVEFATVSRQLAIDMQGVLRSLGYKATLSEKATTYEYKGEKLDGRRAYRLYIRGRLMDKLFHLTRKRERVLPFNGGHVEPWHRVVSVEPSVVDNSRCITVDNLNHLYITDDYVVTHNSKALVLDDIRDAIRYPGIRILFVRRTFDELAESAFVELSKYDFAEALGGKFSRTDRELRFANGSVIRYRFMESMEDASRRQGASYQKLSFDELTLLPVGVADVLQFERLRSASRDIPVLGVRCTGNPGGPGHGAVRERYIDATDHGTKVTIDEFGFSTRFIPSKAVENPHLDAGYHLRLDSIADPARRAAMRDGDWDQFSGQAFTEWSRKRHVVPRFEIPAHWDRFAGLDWGWTAPWAVVWGARDPATGRVFLYREMYARKVPEEEQASRILAAESEVERGIIRFADDACWTARGAGESIADVYARMGCFLDKAGKGPGSRITGIQRVHTFLGEADSVCEFHADLGWDVCARLHVFEGAAPNLVRTLPTLPHATTGNPEDIDTKAEDHAYDALSYLLRNLVESTIEGMTLPVSLPGGFRFVEGQTWADVIGWKDPSART